jgi:hypothetical protein
VVYACAHCTSTNLGGSNNLFFLQHGTLTSGHSDLINISVSSRGRAAASRVHLQPHNKVVPAREVLKSRQSLLLPRLQRFHEADDHLVVRSFLSPPALSKVGLDTRAARRLQAAAITSKLDSRSTPSAPFPQTSVSSSRLFVLRHATLHLPIGRRCRTPEANLTLTTIRSLRTPTTPARTVGRR